MPLRLITRILHARIHPPFRQPGRRRFFFWYFDYWPKNRNNKNRLVIRDPSTPKPLSPPIRVRRHPALYIIGTIPIIALGLGFWQVYRLRWKLGLIEEMDDKLSRGPLWLPQTINVSKIPDFAFRRVLASGHWLSSQTMYVGPRVLNGVHGSHAVTPLARDHDGGSTILVDRGFVSKEYCPGGEKFKESPIYKEAQREAELPDVQVEGLLREGRVKGLFTPTNKPDEAEWYWVDLPAMVEYAGGEQANVQQVFVEETFEGHSGDVNQRLADGIPIGRTARIELRNMHAVYATTWFSLSAATAAMFWALSARRRISGRGKSWRP